MAVGALARREVNRIVLTRPAVEAGERLVPSRRRHGEGRPIPAPLFDALYAMLEPERVNQHLERGVIEVAPLAFMRGRTLSDCFIILDEAQNTTPEADEDVSSRAWASARRWSSPATSADRPRREQKSGRRHRRHLKDVGASTSFASPARTSCSSWIVAATAVLDGSAAAPPVALIEVETDDPRFAALGALSAAGVSDGHWRSSRRRGGIRQLTASTAARTRPTDVLSSRSTRRAHRGAAAEAGDVVSARSHTETWSKRASTV